MNEISNLDDLIVKEGQEFNENESQIINVNKEKDHNLAYDDFGPLPGVKTEIVHEDINENAAEDNVLALTAKMKLKAEQDAFMKLSDNEKIRDYIIQSNYYSQTNNWYHKYGYEMTGPQKRALKRELERAWKKGKFKLTDEQKEDILFELNKASKTMGNTNTANEQQTTETPANHIADLNQLIFK